MEIIVIGLIVAVAACVQGAIGFGLGLISAPLIALIAPELLPTTIILLATVLTISALLRERRETLWRFVGWTTLGRIPGTAAGALGVAFLPGWVITLAVSVAVILAVVLSTLGWRPRHTRTTFLVAGSASGLLGTSTAIGGPPLALVLRGEEPGLVRSTLSGAFLAGSLLSLASLLAVGELRLEHLRAAALLLPFLGAGLLASGIVNRRIDSRRLYIGAVTVSLLGAAVAATTAISQIPL